MSRKTKEKKSDETLSAKYHLKMTPKASINVEAQHENTTDNTEQKIALYRRY